MRCRQRAKTADKIKKIQLDFAELAQEVMRLLKMRESRIHLRGRTKQGRMSRERPRVMGEKSGKKSRERLVVVRES